MRRFISGKRSIYVALAAGLLALGLAVSGGFAHSGPNYAKADIQKNNSTDPLTDCGPLGTSKKIGSATFTSKKGTLTVIGKIHGGAAGSYELDLYRVDRCYVRAGHDPRLVQRRRKRRRQLRRSRAHAVAPISSSTPMISWRTSTTCRPSSISAA